MVLSGGFGVGVVECSNLHSGKLVIVTDVIVRVMRVIVRLSNVLCFVYLFRTH